MDVLNLLRHNVRRLVDGVCDELIVPQREQ
jgi:hypothetical protein